MQAPIASPCIICGADTRFAFAKRFDTHGLGAVEYWRCVACGFTCSYTHSRMKPAAWETLNVASHAAYQGTDEDPGDPRWRTRLEAQARVLDDAAAIGLLDAEGHWIDYACGDGKLADALAKNYARSLLKYDRYMGRGAAYLDDGALVPGGFDLVITTSVFEHIMRRVDFDAIQGLVSPTGVLGIHTLVCESVPDDPTWFYLMPAHCAFHTNRSMQLLFEQWGYTCSVYNVAAQLWLWFKTDPDGIERIVGSANARDGSNPKYVFKRGFVDYWKGSPMARMDGAGKI